MSGKKEKPKLHEVLNLKPGNILYHSNFLAKIKP